MLLRKYQQEDRFYESRLYDSKDLFIGNDGYQNKLIYSSVICSLSFTRGNNKSLFWVALRNFRKERLLKQE